MVEDFMLWLREPFRNTADGPTLGNWLLFLLATLVLLAAWHFLMTHIREAI